MRTQTAPSTIWDEQRFLVDNSVSLAHPTLEDHLTNVLTSNALRRYADVSGIVCDAEAARLEDMMRFLEDRVEKFSSDVDEDWAATIELDQIGTFTPRHGEPVLMRFAPVREGEFTPVEFDEVDMEIIDL